MGNTVQNGRCIDVITESVYSVWHFDYRLSEGNQLYKLKIIKLRELSEVQVRLNEQFRTHSVAVSRGYDTCFGKGLVMGYADC